MRFISGTVRGPLHTCSLKAPLAWSYMYIPIDHCSMWDLNLPACTAFAGILEFLRFPIDIYILYKHWSAWDAGYKADDALGIWSAGRGQQEQHHAGNYGYGHE